MSQSSRDKTAAVRARGDQGPGLSLPRTGAALVLALLGIAWMAVYLSVAQGGGLAWMADLGRWNFTIGFVLLFLGIAAGANPGTRSTSVKLYR